MPILANLLSSLIGNPASKPEQPSQPPSAPIQQQALPPSRPPPPPPPPPSQSVQQPTSDLQPTHPDNVPPHSPFHPRSYRQLSLFLAGAAFLGLTTAVTRRSVTRKIRAAMPRFYQPSYVPEGIAPKVDSAEGTLFALEALSLATLNTFSFGIMATGGLAWAFDISNIEDLRGRAQKHLREKKGERVEGDAEAEDTIEEWMASMLGKDGGKGDAEGEGEGKEERDAKEWMARLMTQAKDKVEGAEEGKK